MAEREEAINKQGEAKIKKPEAVIYRHEAVKE